MNHGLSYWKLEIQRSFDIIKHYIFSSVWQGIKSELQLLISHYLWVLGKHIQLWNDLWCDSLLVLESRKETLISQGINLYSKVSDFILDANWSLHPSWNFLFLTNRLPIFLASEVQEVDILIWPNSNYGSLTLRMLIFSSPPPFLICIGIKRFCVRILPFLSVFWFGCWFTKSFLRTICSRIVAANLLQFVAFVDPMKNILNTCYLIVLLPKAYGIGLGKWLTSILGLLIWKTCFFFAPMVNLDFVLCC